MLAPGHRFPLMRKKGRFCLKRHGRVVEDCHTLGLPQPFGCFCYCKTTEEQNFSANGSCCFCLFSDGSFREGKIDHTLGWLLTFREKLCPVPNPACGRSKTVMLFCIISGNGGMCLRDRRPKCLYLQQKCSCRYTSLAGTGRSGHEKDTWWRKNKYRLSKTLGTSSYN